MEPESFESALDSVIAQFLASSEGVSDDQTLWELQQECIKSNPDFATALAEFFYQQSRLVSGFSTLDDQLPPFDNYSNIKLVGRGGMGSVFSAIEANPPREVAIKISHWPLAASPDLAAWSRSEVDHLAQLDHPNILPIYRVGEWQGHLYFTMKLAKGGALSQYASAPLLPQTTAVKLMIQVAHAIYHAHQQGILHCDLKPSNILIGDDIQNPKPYVADFSLAIALSGGSGGEGSALVGTPSYRAPEKQTSIYSDVYGMGAVLFTVLTGHKPDIRLPCHTILSAGTQAPFSADLSAICQKCLHTNPKERYSSALAFAKDLERWLQQEPTEARPLGPFHRMVRWMRRKPLPALLSMASVSLTLTLAVHLFESYAQNKELLIEQQQLLVVQAKSLERQRRLLLFIRNGDRVQDFWKQLETLRHNSDLLQAFSAAVTDAKLADIRKQLNDPALETQVGTLRWKEKQAPLITHPARAPLQAYIENLFLQSDPKKVFAWFAQDSEGLQIARGPIGENNLGANFAARTYFNGAELDYLDHQAYLNTHPDNRQLVNTHLSKDFCTRLTNEWVIAVSTPIKSNGEFLGVLGVFLYINPPTGTAKKILADCCAHFSSLQRLKEMHTHRYAKENTMSTHNPRENLSIKILIALVLALLTGTLINQLFSDSMLIQKYLVQGVFHVVGSLFMAALKMMIVPLVFFGLASGVAGVTDIKQMGRMGGKALGLYLFTTVVAISLGISAALLVGLGKDLDLQADQVSINVRTEVPNLVDRIIYLIPESPLAALASGDMLPIIFFTLLLGTAIALTGEKARPMAAVVEAGNDVMLKMVGLIMKLAPFGLFCLMTKIFSENGILLILPLLGYFLVMVFVLLLHACGTYGLLLSIVAKLNPRVFFSKMRTNQLFAFSTASSSATLPVTLRTVEKRLGVDKIVASFTVPLGATLNMDGTAIMQGVAAVFVANAYNVDLSLVDYLIVIGTATLASIGTAGVRGAGTIMLAMVFQQVGLPVQGISLIMAVDPILDMVRTAVNVTGDAAVTTIVAKSEKALDLQAFNDPDAGALDQHELDLHPMGEEARQ